jgi:ribosomal protein S8
MKNIIAIMDIESTTVSKDTKEFLKIAEEEGFIESISNDLPKSFIITEIDKKSKIYLSPISSVTLQKRSGFIDAISNV